MLRLHPRLAPNKVAVLPLSKKDELIGPSPARCSTSSRRTTSATTTRRSPSASATRRQDEVGTPLCVTVDFDTLEDRAVTVRERDSMEQVRVPIDEVVADLRRQARLLRSAPPVRGGVGTLAAADADGLD